MIRCGPLWCVSNHAKALSILGVCRSVGKVIRQIETLGIEANFESLRCRLEGVSFDKSNENQGVLCFFNGGGVALLAPFDRCGF